MSPTRVGVSSREISRGDRTSCTGADSSQVIRLQRAQKLSSCSVIEQHQEADSVAGGGVDLYSDQVFLSKRRRHVVERGVGKKDPLAGAIDRLAAGLCGQAGLYALNRLRHRKQFLHVLFGEKKHRCLPVSMRPGSVPRRNERLPRLLKLQPPGKRGRDQKGKACGQVGKR